MGRAMAQTVSRQPPTAEARARARVSPCWICGGHIGTGTGFSPSYSQYHHSTGAPHSYISSSGGRAIGPLVDAVRSYSLTPSTSRPIGDSNIEIHPRIFSFWGVGWIYLADCCEHGNNNSTSIKYVKFLDQLNYNHVFNKGSVALSLNNNNNNSNNNNYNNLNQKRWNVEERSGFIWLRIGTSGGLLWTR